jgi:methylmalonyl-CoA mutase C-terminal domain/subunit
VINKLAEVGLGDVKVFVGGIIPENDIPGLKAHGVYAVYGPGTDTAKVAEDIKIALQAPTE